MIINQLDNVKIKRNFKYTLQILSGFLQFLWKILFKLAEINKILFTY